MKGFFGRKLPLSIMADSDILIKTLPKSGITSENPLTIDMRATREAFDRNEILEIGRIRSQNNIADGLMKMKRYRSIEKVLFEKKLVLFTEQWIERSTAKHSGNIPVSDNQQDSHHKETWCVDINSHDTRYRPIWLRTH